MKVLIIINKAPYGSEDAYNALRLAMALQNEQKNIEIRIFLMADAVLCALPKQVTPDGYYNIERMFKAVINKGGEIKACGSCSQSRGLKDLALVDGVRISSINQLAEWVAEADKIMTF